MGFAKRDIALSGEGVFTCSNPSYGSLSLPCQQTMIDFGRVFMCLINDQQFGMQRKSFREETFQGLGQRFPPLRRANRYR